MRLKLPAMVFAFVLVFSLVGLAHASFPDIQGHWAQPQVEKWTAQGLAGGYPDGTFRPGGQVTRAEFVSFMNRALGRHKPGAACDFKDVKASDWYYAEVATAQTAGYLIGYEDGTFRPNSPISRQEVASVITRLDCLQAVTGQAAFADTGTIKPWALDAVGKMAAAGIMGGYPDNTFGPNTPLSRAEAVVTLDRVVAKCGEPVKVFDAVQGTVTLDGSPVEGATVRLFTSEGRLDVFEEYRTGKDGKYQFRVVSGKYGLTAVKGDYVAARTVTVTQDTVCDLALAAGTVLTGTLADKNGDPVPEAKLYFTANPVFFTTTDSDGNFRLAVPRGRTYTIWAHKDNDPSFGLVIIAENVQVGRLGAYALDAFETDYALPARIVGGGGAPTAARFTTASITTVDEEEEEEVHDVTLAPDGLSGTVNLSGSHGYVTAGSVTANVTGTLKITGVVDGNGHDLSVLLPGKFLTLSLTADTPEDLDLITYLGGLDPQDDGVSLSHLRSMFDDLVTVSGKLGTTDVSLTIRLQP